MRGIGTDIIEISRVAEKIHDEKFMNRIFTQAEKAYIAAGVKASAERAAGMFCAKEAVAKALGTGFGHGLRFTDIEISHTELGAPVASVADRAELALSLSISHCREYATATAVIWEA